jgi:hypothetical protein
MNQELRNRVYSFIGIALIAFSSLHIVFNVQRTDFIELFSVYSIGFIGLVLVFKYANQKDLFLLIFSGLIIRFVMINVTPELSNDFYRFVWDGEMLNMGMSPYVKTPNEIISSTPEIFQNAELRALYHGMGELSQGNYSNYPPINEIMFLIASKLGSTLSSKLIVLRILIILADIGIVLIGISILKILQLNSKNIFLFAINPFILIEFTGNLHFEGVMLFFFLMAFYLYIKDMKLLSAFFFAFSILTKVLTLIFLPLFIRKNDLKKSLVYVLLVGVFTMVFAYPFFINSGFESYNSSNSLYFQNFEFNASIYYVVREIGWLIKGYNPIAFIGPALAIISLISILYWYFRNRNESFLNSFNIWTIAFLIFLGLSTTVHPWYIGILLIVGIFTKYKFPVVWSFLAFISYYLYAENATTMMYYSLITLEYLIVFGYLFYELKIHSSKLVNQEVKV